MKTHAVFFTHGLQCWAAPVLLGILLTGSGAMAQEAKDSGTPPELFGKIHGTVRNARNAMFVSGATVIVDCDCLDGSYEIRTDARGMYLFDAAPAGHYTVQAFVGEVRDTRMFDLGMGEIARQDFSLQLADDGGGPGVDIRPSSGSTGGAAHCSVDVRPGFGVYWELVVLAIVGFCGRGLNPRDPNPRRP